MDDREYELKKAELALREREVAAKEKEGKASKYFNPVTIAIYVAAIGLFGNILTNYSTNKASEDAEHFRAQSSLVLSVIKTNGDEDAACKNLNFFVQIGWLDDPNGTIQTRCGTKGKSGVPTLDQPPPGIVLGGQPGFSNLKIRVEDADSHQPIANAEVQQQLVSISGGSVLPSVKTDTAGTAILKFVTPYDRLTVLKNGYETVAGSMDQFGAVSSTNRTITIGLRQTPASKQ